MSSERPDRDPSLPVADDIREALHIAALQAMGQRLVRPMDPEELATGELRYSARVDHATADRREYMRAARNILDVDERLSRGDFVFVAQLLAWCGEVVRAVDPGDQLATFPLSFDESLEIAREVMVGSGSDEQPVPFLGLALDAMRTAYEQACAEAFPAADN